MSLLTLETLTVRRGQCPVVDGVSFQIGKGELIGLIGPNGAGKTSLMRAALGLLAHEGRSSLAQMRASERAKLAAWMPQQREIAWPVTVETVVALGRMPHRPTGAKLSAQDQAQVDKALDRMGLTGFRDRAANALSGGEQARVLIARALAQDTPLLVADEPIAGLDPAAQIATLRVFRDLAAEGHTVLVSLHDLSLAARYCGRLLMLDKGRLVADGTPAEVLTEGNLATTFHIRARVIDTEHGALFQPIDVLP
ncbi:ABC transporter ATP-binding protein [Pseudoprimorskyibacter insulae]|uniref:Fe(3+) dicitrate transport ATP-binding protein FecE n=1 Tax=Pseudoprimorskyibacter insulae TaxID=1695997 RepID=A0A2R8AQN7_9RHOB|nr:ABC transporter ATP-binding protein [Pseudoprimorskyibacter insulae]SPF78372.1 Fe(3+) dicitrate transport ATP-binding protein FecE [Pseudoprimorskyibacter insulae]